MPEQVVRRVLGGSIPSVWKAQTTAWLVPGKGAALSGVNRGLEIQILEIATRQRRFSIGFEIGALVSKYEQRFGVKRRGRGRPVGSDVVFQMRDKDPELARQARQRAIALIIDDNKPQMRRLFEDEYRYLANGGGRTRRGRRRAGTG